MTYSIFGMILLLNGGVWWSSDCTLGYQVRGLRFKPRPGKNYGSRFLLHVQFLCTPTQPLGPQIKSIPEPVPCLELTWFEEERIKRKGADTSGRKEKTRKKSKDIGTEKKTEKLQDMDRAVKICQKSICVNVRPVDD